MSLASIKRHNHRVHPCESSRKQELLKELIEQYQGKTILVISQNNTTTTQIEQKGLTLSNDEELKKLEGSWDILISFELPQEAQDYLNRLESVSEMALILFDQKEQTRLYAVEKLLGKNIKQELIKGYEPQKAKTSPNKSKPTKSQERHAADQQAKKEQKKQGFSAKKEWSKPSAKPHHHDKGSNPQKRAPRKIQIKKAPETKKD